MTSSTETAASRSDSQLATVMQYTIEAYKIFQKLAELLPNPMAAAVFNNFAEDERGNRDLLEIKYLDPGVSRLKIGLGSDLRIQDALEGNLSHRELTEVLITRELTMAHWLRNAALDCRDIDRNLFNYLAFCKQAHIVYLEREMQLLGIYEDWYKREDAESLIVAGRSMV